MTIRELISQWQTKCEKQSDSSHPMFLKIFKCLIEHNVCNVTWVFIKNTAEPHFHLYLESHNPFSVSCFKVNFQIWFLIFVAISKKFMIQFSKSPLHNWILSNKSSLISIKTNSETLIGFFPYFIICFQIRGFMGIYNSQTHYHNWSNVFHW